MGLETGLGQTSSSAGSVWTTIERAITARRGAFALAFIILVSLAFRLHVSHECSLWLDEVSTHRDALKPWAQVLKGPSREHPPLMYLLVLGAIRVFGESATGLRSVSLFFGCVLLVAVYELCLELRLSVGLSLVVIGTFALSPFFIRYATEARHYAILAAFVTLATTRVLRVLRGPPRVRDFLGFALSAFAGAYTQYFGLAYALALLGALLIGIRPVWKQSRPWQRVLLVGSLIGLLALLWFVAVRAAAVGSLYAHGNGEAAAGLVFNRELLREILGDFSFMASEAWSLAIEPLCALVGLLLLTWRLRGSARLLPLGVAAAPCLVALFISSEHFVAARYLAPSAVFYHVAACIALFAAIDRLRVVLARSKRTQRFAPLVGGLALSGLLTARLREFPNGFGIGGDDYAGLQRYFLRNLAKDTRVVAYYGYFGRLLLGEEYRLGSPPIYLEKFRPVRGIDRYLLVEIHINGADRRADLEALVERQFGISPQAFRALPLVPLPHSIYQPAVPAHLLELPSDRALSRPEKKPHSKP